MKNFILGFSALLIISSCFTSCTIEKRIHQEGYHISWKHRHAKPSEIFQNKGSEEDTAELGYTPADQELENHARANSIESLSSNISESLPVFTKKKNFIHHNQDTVIPEQKTQQEEYFNNTYKAPTTPNELQDTKLANWALGLGIGAVSAPIWSTLLFLLIFAIAGASWSSTTAWTALGLAFLLGGGLFIALEILAITFGVRFLRMHAKDPLYYKYKGRAITGLVLAGIYPALILINIILAIFLAI
jgi:hypothetical protein